MSLYESRNILAPAFSKSCTAKAGTNFTYFLVVDVDAIGICPVKGLTEGNFIYGFIVKGAPLFEAPGYKWEVWRFQNIE